MAYQSTVWLGTLASLCPSQDTAGDGTTTLTDFALASNGLLTNMDPATDWVTSESKRALDFDGTNDHVVTSNFLIHYTTKFTLSFWIKRSSASVRGPGVGFATALTTTGAFAFLPYEDGKFYFKMAATQYGFITSNDTSWHHVLCAYDGTGAANADRLKVWLDGVSQTVTFSGTIPAFLTVLAGATCRLWLGVAIDGNTNYYGSGLLDDVRVMGRVASSGEQTELAASRGGTFAAATGGGLLVHTGMSGGMRA